jgi:hypothetical protein
VDELQRDDAGEIRPPRPAQAGHRAQARLRQDDEPWPPPPGGQDRAAPRRRDHAAAKRASPGRVHPGHRPRPPCPGRRHAWACTSFITPCTPTSSAVSMPASPVHGGCFAPLASRPLCTPSPAAPFASLRRAHTRMSSRLRWSRAAVLAEECDESEEEGHMPRALLPESQKKRLRICRHQIKLRRCRTEFCRHQIDHCYRRFDLCCRRIYLLHY